MAQIFYVHCPACRGKFPVHPELWQVDYDLLCPFCQRTFPQETSPLIITATGEKRPGRSVASASPPPAPTGPSAGPLETRAEEPKGRADSM